MQTYNDVMYYSTGSIVALNVHQLKADRATGCRRRQGLVPDASKPVEAGLTYAAPTCVAVSTV